MLFRKLAKLLKTWPNSTEDKKQLNKTLNGINLTIIHINKTLVDINNNMKDEKCKTIITEHINNILVGLNDKIDDKECQSTFTKSKKNRIIYNFLQFAIFLLKISLKQSKWQIQTAVNFLKTGNFRYLTVPVDEKAEQLTERLR